MVKDVYSMAIFVYTRNRRSWRVTLLGTMQAVKDPWESQASAALRTLMRERGVSYAVLAQALASQGEQLTAASLTKKAYRGAFSLAFFLKCAAAIDQLAPEDASAPQAVPEAAAAKVLPRLVARSSVRS